MARRNIITAVVLAFLAFGLSPSHRIASRVPRAGCALTAPSKYEKCRLKCLRRHEECRQKIRNFRDREARLYEETRCDMRKRKCLVKCE